MAQYIEAIKNPIPKYRKKTILFMMAFFSGSSYMSDKPSIIPIPFWHKYIDAAKEKAAEVINKNGLSFGFCFFRFPEANTIKRPTIGVRNRERKNPQVFPA